jgi:hypothetical protein
METGTEPPLNEHQVVIIALAVLLVVVLVRPVAAQRTYLARESDPFL